MKMTVKKIENLAEYMNHVFTRNLTVQLENGVEVVLFDDNIRDYKVGDVFYGDILSPADISLNKRRWPGQSSFEIKIVDECFLPFSGKYYKANSDLVPIYDRHSKELERMQRINHFSIYYSYFRLYLTYEFQENTQGLEIYNSIRKIASHLSKKIDENNIARIKIWNDENNLIQINFNGEQYSICYMNKVIPIRTDDSLDPMYLNIKMLLDFIYMQTNNEVQANRKSFGDIEVMFTNEEMQEYLYLDTKENLQIKIICEVLCKKVLEVCNERL